MLSTYGLAGRTPRCGRPTRACGRRRPGRRGGRCARRRSRAGPGSARRAAARRAARRSRPAPRRSPGAGMPSRAAVATTRRQASCAVARPPRRSSVGQQRGQVRVVGRTPRGSGRGSGPDDAAAAPDRGDRAQVDVPAVLGGAGGDLVEALRVGDDLRRVQRLLGRRRRSRRRPRPRRRRAGPGQAARAAARCSAWPDSERANTASAMPVTGTPRSSAVCTVQRPVPFCSAWSRTTSTNGLPVAGVDVRRAPRR